MPDVLPADERAEPHSNQERDLEIFLYGVNICFDLPQMSLD
jgi:hypothetical protein